MKEYSIQDFAKRTGVSMDRLRNYEKLGIITPKRNTQNNYRYYTDYDFLDLQRVCMLQSIGVPLRKTLPEQRFYSPAYFRQEVQSRILKIREEMEKLDTQLKMLMDIEMRSPEMSNFQCREWNALPFYVLYHDECTDPTLMQNWMDHVPHVLTSFMIPAEQLQEEGRRHFDAKIGMGIVDKHVYSMPLRLDQPVRHVEAFRGIRCILSLHDPLKPAADEFSIIFEYLRNHNMTIAGDVHMGIRGSDEDEKGTVYYMRVLVLYIICDFWKSVNSDRGSHFLMEGGR